MSKFPAQIDNSITLPAAVDNSTPIGAGIFNNLRSAVLQIEAELGVKPSGVSSTVRGRLDTIDTTLLSAVSLSNDLGNTASHPYVIGIQGRPISSQAPVVGEILGWNGIVWMPMLPAPGITTVFSGDIVGLYPTPTVVRIQGNTIKSGSLGSTQDGYTLTWNNSAGEWQPQPAASGFAAGGDLTGTSASQQVVSLTGSGGIVSAGSAKIKWTQPGTIPSPTTFVPWAVQPTDPAKAPFAMYLESSTFFSTVDTRASIGYNPKRQFVSEPAFYWTIEENYETPALTHAFESYWQYEDGVTSCRPIFVTVNRSTGVAAVQLVGDGGVSIGNQAETHQWATFSQAQHTIGELVSPLTLNGSVLNINGASNSSWTFSASLFISATTQLRTDSNLQTFRDGGSSNMLVLDASGSKVTIGGGPQYQFDLAYGGNLAMHFSNASSPTSATIKFDDVVTNSATGKVLTIQGQNATGTTAIGGNLALTSGTGSSADGYTYLKTGGTTRLTVKPTGVVTIANLGVGAVQSDASGNLTSSTLAVTNGGAAWKHLIITPFAGTTNTASGTYVVAGTFELNPLELADGYTTIKLRCIGETTSPQMSIKLYNLTAAADVTGSTLTTSSTVPVALTTGDLTANLTNGYAMYQVQILMAAGVPADQVILDMANIRVDWV